MVGGDSRTGLFVAHSNRFFIEGRHGFTEPASLKTTFAWEPLHNEDWPCGAVFGDLNRDGRQDLVLSIHGEPARNRIYLNAGAKGGAGQADRLGVPAFRDVTKQTGLPDQWPTRVPHAEIQDFDNDGWPDLYFSAGWRGEDGAITPLVYRNLGCKPGGVPRFAGPEQPANAKPVYFPAGPTADYDGDGRLDLLLVNWFEGNHTRLLRNTTPGGNWLRVQVHAKGRVNREGIGLTVEVAGIGRREIATGYGYASGQVPMAHFGLGERKVVEKVTVSGHRYGVGQTTRANVKGGQVLTIEVP
jgi:hypothetical protein